MMIGTSRWGPRIAAIGLCIAALHAKTANAQGEDPNICSLDTETNYNPKPVSVSLANGNITFKQKIGQTWSAARQIQGYNIRAFTTEHYHSYDNSADGKPMAAFFAGTYRADLIYGTRELNVLKSWNVNTIRFQISQYYIGSDDPASASYLKCLYKAIRLARQNDFLVVLAMQNQKSPDPAEATGHSFFNSLPEAITKAAWNIINNEFGDDNGVMYDLYNEPAFTIYDKDATGKETSPDGPSASLISARYNGHTLNDLWFAWRNGASGTRTAFNKLDCDGNGIDDDDRAQADYVGHQELVNFLRGRNPKGNIIKGAVDNPTLSKILIVEGLALGGSYEGFKYAGGDFRLVDGANISAPRIVYSVHPYLRGLIPPRDLTEDLTNVSQSDATSKAIDTFYTGKYDDRWGFLKSDLGLPVMITEWQQGTDLYAFDDEDEDGDPDEGRVVNACKQAVPLPASQPWRSGPDYGPGPDNVFGTADDPLTPAQIRTARNIMINQQALFFNYINTRKISFIPSAFDISGLTHLVDIAFQLRCKNGETSEEGLSCTHKVYWEPTHVSTDPNPDLENPSPPGDGGPTPQPASRWKAIGGGTGILTCRYYADGVFAMPMITYGANDLKQTSGTSTSPCEVKYPD